MSQYEGVIWCDGMPTMAGCNEWTKPTRPYVREGRKKSGWLVTHSVDEIGHPEEPRLLLHFCPSCAVVVLSQEARS